MPRAFHVKHELFLRMEAIDGPSDDVFGAPRHAQPCNRSAGLRNSCVQLSPVRGLFIHRVLTVKWREFVLVD